mmetsp:Transcript_22741/g.36265  ORF Transcript_22741/g.36265 Transcript_22741/m.36265 type:complete len:1073 (+) Transcript_22741:132-3350(+)|eukprot:CAMPEP_0203758338 /NCGR_PEP_ID=MMETSP0098-20131031/11121_1 /ASSEMBLY_ACC=CAM_ASM_000208 /TAXON_ID=96639 /ORGANISM=" , Strain NY0313808BC1" /LENGTH=1072 /DNA_ID=CAMNT_0050650697 /DNA_START=95 /DNA_END=3313 /DNA_ORIENTATION=+
MELGVGLDAEELRENVFETLRDSGAVARLKAQLRCQVIDQLRKKGDRHVFSENAGVFTGGTKAPQEVPIEEVIMASLIVEYLQKMDMMYTLSIFIPEGRMEKIEPLSRGQMHRILGLKENGGCLENDENNGSNGSNARAHKKLKPDGPVLLELLNQKSHMKPIVTLGGNTQRATLKDTETQTLANDKFEGDTATMVLERKLGNVSDRYSMLLEREALAPRRTIEERMIRYQRDCDERAEKLIRSEVSRFRETELTHMKMQERALLRREFHKEKDSMHQEYQSKVAHLAKREAALVQQISRREAEIETQLFEERQELLRKIESIGEKGRHERRSHEVDVRGLQEDRKRLEQTKLELDNKQLEIQKLESELRRKYDEEIRTFRQSVLAEYEHRERAVRREELELKKEREALESARKSHTAKFEAAEMISQEVQALDEKLRETEKERDELRFASGAFESQKEFITQTAEKDRERYDKLYSKYIDTCKELENVRVKLELSSGTGDVVENRERALANLREKLAETTDELNGQIQQLERQCHQLEVEKQRDAAYFEEQYSKAEVAYKQRIADLADRMSATQQESQYIQGQHEENIATISNLQAENADLRQLLTQARKALNEELSQPKKATEDSEHPAREPVPRYSSPMPYYMASPPPQAPFQQFYSPSIGSPPQDNLTQQLLMLQQQMMKMMEVKDESTPAKGTPQQPFSEGREEKFSPTSPGERPQRAKTLQSSPKPTTAQSSSTRSNLSVHISPKAHKPSSPRGEQQRSPKSPRTAESKNSYTVSAEDVTPHRALDEQEEPLLTVETRGIGSDRDVSTVAKNPSPANLGSPSTETKFASSQSEASSPLPAPKTPSPKVVTKVTENLTSDVASPKSSSSSKVATADVAQAPVLSPKHVEPNAVGDGSTMASTGQEDEEDAAQKALQLHREAQDRKRKLQLQRQKERQRRVLETERQQREEQAREKEVAEQKAREAKAKEEEAKRELEREELEKKKKDDEVIQMYRQKALEKLESQKGQFSGETGAVATSTSAGGSSPKTTVSSPRQDDVSVDSDISVPSESLSDGGNNSSDNDSFGF